MATAVRPVPGERYPVLSPAFGSHGSTENPFEVSGRGVERGDRQGLGQAAILVIFSYTPIEVDEHDPGRHVDEPRAIRPANSDAAYRHIPVVLGHRPARSVRLSSSNLFEPRRC